MSAVTSAGSSVPDSDVIVGVCADLRHAVTRERAVRVTVDGSFPSGPVAAVCGQLVHLAPRMGAYGPDSRYLRRGDVCVRCAWIVAAARDDVTGEIAAVAPGEDHRAMFAEVLGDPLLGVRLLEAIAADEELLESWVPGFHRSQRADLLARAAQHLPHVVLCEDCSEGAGVERDAACGCAALLCTTCTLSAGPWAGEWEGYTVEQCIVAAPCSVLSALCDHYLIPLRQNATAGQVGRP